MGRLVFVHRIDSNVGDRLSGPYLHWEWEQHDVVDICDAERVDAIEPGARIVIGGGGLLLPYFLPFLKRLLHRAPSRVVWWGIGERMVQDLDTGYLPEADCGEGISAGTFPDGHLVGVRIRPCPYRHVPCCSCKFVAATRRGAAAQHDVVVFEHEAIPIPLNDGSPRMVNTRCAPAEAVHFIESGRIVVTNSYHGMYWARLLGKPVVCIPFSSGHYRNDWGVLYTDHARLGMTIRTALRTAPDACPGHHLPLLENAIELNESFRQEVLRFLAH